jgi:hypothetical protein
LAERSGTGAQRKRLAALNAALLTGLVAGIADGVAVVLENPQSFHGAGDVARFTAGAAAVCLVAAVPAGVIGAAGRWPAARVAGAGSALLLFAWFGVRAHVRWFFGEPLTAPAQAAAMIGILAGSGWVGWAIARPLGRPLEGVASRGVALLAPAAVLLAAAAVLRIPVPVPVEPPLTPSAPSVDAPDILLVTLDTTRADHLSCYGYPRGTTPAIDRVARGGYLWHSVWSPIPLTNPSHASMFTGLPPRRHGVLNNGTALPDSIPTHVEELARRGYRCAAFVSGIPLKVGLSGLARGFAVYDDAFSPLERMHPMLTTLAAVRVVNRVLPLDLIERHAERTCAAADRWLRETDGPAFAWVHLFDPHSPYDAPEPLPAYFRAQGGHWTAHGTASREWPIADYDAEILRADRALSGLIRTFEEVSGGRGKILVTADHGEGLNEHGELTHGTQLFQEDITVPFVLRDQALRLSPRILPGRPLAELVPWVLVGRLPGLASEGALVETFAPEGRTDRSALLGMGLSGAIPAPARLRNGKLIRNQETGEDTAYDLEGDPGELRPIPPAPEWDLVIRQVLPSGRVDRTVDLDPDTERRLRALGYIH